ncbi:Asp23/Gls24 family envelope stress response protein [Dactylosporangium aurantiacum]|uniref:Asp23/Gls24 family envelope stress response protein n=2 Tax=Dactylosporangium aurantiacum TaxID=35754 RepID=A0A9Q9ITA1_9ACTN|nr:Asp23/Gls24 family envelope stress response protein [Dactylosporangium aurantiacum]
MTGDALSVEPAAPGSVAGTTAERVGAFASDAADRVGELASTTAAASGRIAAQVVDRLRNSAELTAERGTTTIADEVVEKIAGIAAREVPGVYDLGGDVARVFASVRDRIGLGDGEERESGNRGVQVRLEGRSAAVRVTLVIEYGFVLYSVAEKVRANVIGAVENLLGLEVTSVDIVVDDVHVSDTLPESAAASAA